MIKCHLSTLMGAKKLKLIDVARDTGINRGTITRLYHETATRVDLEVIETLCRYLDCEVGELREQTELRRKTRCVDEGPIHATRSNGEKGGGQQSVTDPFHW